MRKTSAFGVALVLLSTAFSAAASARVIQHPTCEVLVDDGNVSPSLMLRPAPYGLAQAAVSVLTSKGYLVRYYARYSYDNATQSFYDHGLSSASPGDLAFDLRLGFGSGGFTYECEAEGKLFRVTDVDASTEQVDTVTLFQNMVNKKGIGKMNCEPTVRAALASLPECQIAR